jgi:hypothetical protein
MVPDSSLPAHPKCGSSFPGLEPFLLLGGCLITTVIIRYCSGIAPLPERDTSYWLVRDNGVQGWNNVI